MGNGQREKGGRQTRGRRRSEVRGGKERTYAAEGGGGPGSDSPFRPSRQAEHTTGSFKRGSGEFERGVAARLPDRPCRRLYRHPRPSPRSRRLSPWDSAEPSPPGGIAERVGRAQGVVPPPPPRLIKFSPGCEISV